MIDNIICVEEATVLDTLRIINENGKGVAFVVGKGNKLSGIITDGDVRRYLLNGGGLHEKVADVCNTDFVYARSDESYEQMIGKFSDKVGIIPVVDSNFSVVDFLEHRSNLYLPIALPDLGDKEFKYLVDAFLSTWISSTGSYITLFEQKMAQYCNCEYGVAVSNGTVALHLALVALGVSDGDEVIVPDLTFAATINAVLHANATPVIVDVEPDSWCIDPREIEKAITPKTKAIIPVHLYGQPCDMDAIMDIAREHNLYVVEDCAEAHGAEYLGRKVGSFGDIGCFSFFGNKVITTGEGGMCVTGSAELNDRMRLYRDHGMSRKEKYRHDVVGYNYRMTNLQAAIGVAQVERIDEILARREEIEENYRSILKGLDFLEFQLRDLPGRKKITWLVSLMVNGRDRGEYMAHLKKNGLDTRPFFYPLSEMEIYRSYLFSNNNALDISKRGISLPTFCDLGEVKREWFVV